MLGWAGIEVDPGIGPGSLPLKWRVLYTVFDVFDDLRGSIADCVLEGQLIGKLACDAQVADELGLVPPSGGQTLDDYTASLDPGARERVRSVLTELRGDLLLDVKDDPRRGWLIIPLAPGLRLVTGWRRYWIERRPFSTPGQEGLRIIDAELRQRCERLLALGEPFDTVIHEACVVLEHRVRKAIAAEPTVVGVDLMKRAFNPSNGPLKLTDVEPQQLGAMQLYQGIMAYTRNPAGHHLSDTVSREDALRIVGFIDWLLGLIEGAQRGSKRTT